MSKYHSLRATLNYFDGIFQISRRSHTDSRLKTGNSDSLLSLIHKFLITKATLEVEDDGKSVCQ